MPNLFRFIFPFILLLTSLKGLSQVYPVQSTLQITPPYSLSLADYVAPGSERMALNVFLADVNRSELSVRFKLRIEGTGILIETKTEFLPEPMTIHGGVSLRLIGADLVDYFDPRNLNFSGITQREYQQKAALPEGIYRFTFEVLEYNRGVKVSNSASVTGWLILNDPPLINLPRDNEKIRIQSPQMVLFQWTPRHTGSPNSAFTTEYEFQLVEVWPATRNPNDAILTSPVIFETTTSSTTLVYGAAETPLEPGRRYAFRVKAKSIVGVDELNLFKNNGYSQVGTFVFGDACTLPTGIIPDLVGSTKVHLAWDTQDNHTGYLVKYRLANTAGAEWYTNESALNDLDINSLQPSTTYEYQVAASCGAFDSEYSPTATVTTKEPQAITYSCGLPLNPFDLDPSQLIESLKTGDVIQAGDFEVKLTQVSGSNGIFTGKGVIEMPYFNQAKVLAEFSGISVNKELRMVAGSMNITGAGVEVIPAGVMDVMDQLSEVLAVADSALNMIESNLPGQFDPHSFVAESQIKMSGAIVSIAKAADGSVIVTDDKGNQKTIPAGQTAAVTDIKGNGYLVDSKGNIHNTTAAIAAAAAKREYNLNVNFAKATDSKFGFDKKKHDALINTYEHLKDEYYASWKSVATGQTDNVFALLDGTNVDKSKIHFEQGGQSVTSTQGQNANTSVLSVKGIADGVEEGLVALYTPADTAKKEQVLGKVNVVTYNQIDKRVVIVPVNGNTFDKFGIVKTLQDSLNRIYGQAVVNWTVELKAGITVDGISPFHEGGTGLLSNFTDHMKQVIDVYKSNVIPDTYYLFLVSNPEDPSVLGVMPRSKNYGFIFADKHSTLPSIARTMAHELGHGAFNLHHTFMEPNFTITQGTTDNLMDYPAGPKLYKYQWDKIRYPDIVVGVFESDEEGQLGISSDIVGYVISDPKAISREFQLPNNPIQPQELLTQGKEVLLVSLQSGTKMAFVKYLTDNTNEPISNGRIYVTSASNIKPILKLPELQKYLCVKDDNAIVLPFSPLDARKAITKNSYISVIRICEEYLQVFREDADMNEGWWVHKSFFKRVGDDIDPTFNWMENVTADDNINQESIASILNNRKGVNDRSDQDIYGKGKNLRLYIYTDEKGVKHEKGFFYTSSDTGYPDNITGTDFEKDLKKKILDELAKEGSYGSINAYDGEIFTWGKGFAITGSLMDVFAKLFENKDLNFEQIFTNVGIKVVDDALWVVNEKGEWLKDVPPKKSDYFASAYIRGNKELMSFFIELAEKDGYRQAVMNAQYAVLQEGTGAANYPSYIVNKDKTGYADSWNDGSATILAHLSHWCGYSWSQGTDRYKDTNGILSNILYKYIYNTLVYYSDVRDGEALQTNIYKWRTGKYQIFDRLEGFGITEPEALTTLNSTWSANLIELEFKNDKENVKRAVKQDADKYVTNSQSVLLKRQTGYTVMTPNATAITYGDFKAQ